MKIVLSVLLLFFTCITYSQDIEGKWTNKVSYYDGINEEHKSYVVEGSIIKKDNQYYLKAWCRDLKNNTENRFKVKLIVTSSSIVIFPHNYIYVQYYSKSKKWTTITPKHENWVELSVMSCDDVVTLYSYSECNKDILEGYCTDNVMYWKLIKETKIIYP